MDRHTLQPVYCTEIRGHLTPPAPPPLFCMGYFGAVRKQDPFFVRLHSSARGSYCARGGREARSRRRRASRNAKRPRARKEPKRAGKPRLQADPPRVPSPSDCGGKRSAPVSPAFPPASGQSGLPARHSQPSACFPCRRPWAGPARPSHGAGPGRGLPLLPLLSAPLRSPPAWGGGAPSSSSAALSPPLTWRLSGLRLPGRLVLAGGLSGGSVHGQLPGSGGSGEGGEGERVAAAADTGQTLKRMSGASSSREGSDGSTRGGRSQPGPLQLFMAPPSALHAANPDVDRLSGARPLPPPQDHCSQHARW